MQTEDFNQLSYQRHEKHLARRAREQAEAKHLKTWLDTDTVDAWRHGRMYQCLDPLLNAYPQANWLTVGDGRYGKDAHYIKEKGLKVLATNLSDVFLKEAKETGYIDDYSQENAENLSFQDQEFDFVFCKEAYHHFPRPMIALYEMLRVARHGVVLIEPQDKYSTVNFSVSLFIRIKDLIKKALGKKVIKHGYEEVGNYVYTISEREIEKVALGMNFRTVTFKGINDYYEPGVEYEKADNESKIFKQLKAKISWEDFLSKLGFKPHNLLTAIIFKVELQPDLEKHLKAAGYQVINLPKNPYI